jgi:transcriptional regulator with XRE-family HTH domain
MRCGVYCCPYKRVSNMSESTKRSLTPRQTRAAENIRHYWHKKRTTERITQTEFSKQMGWSHSIFGQYLNGRVAAGPTALFKMAEGLGCTPYDLDPELRAAFTPAPEDLHDLRASLQKMDAIQKKRVITLLTQRLGNDDLMQVMAEILSLVQIRTAPDEHTPE